MDIQQIFAIAISLAAAAYLLKRSVAVLRSSGGGCGSGSCSGCPSAVAGEQKASMPARKQLYSLTDK